MLHIASWTGIPQQIGYQRKPMDNLEKLTASNAVCVPPFAITDEDEAILSATSPGAEPNVPEEAPPHVPPFVLMQRWTEQPYPASAESIADTEPHRPASMESLQEIPVIDLPTNEVNEDWEIPFGRQLRNLTRQLRQQGLRVTLIEAADQIHRMLFGLPTLRYSQVAPNLFVGGQHHANGWRRLQARGITAVVNMRRESDDRARGVAPEHYLHLMTLDNTPPTLEHLRKGVAFICGELLRGGKVYIHCWEGVGRAPTMCAAYLVSRGFTPDEAWAHIRATRPFIRPTPFQIKQVEVYAKEFGYGAAD